MCHFRQFADKPLAFCEKYFGESITVDDVEDENHSAEYANAPTAKQIEIMNAVRDHKRVAVPSANNVGKSHIAARIAIWFLLTHQPSIVILTAPKQVQVKDILWGRMRQALQSWKGKNGYPGECLTESYYPDRENYPNWFARGMTARDAESFSGWHEHSVLFILDEASGIPPHIFAGLDGMMSGGDCKLLEISNPTTRNSEFYKHCQSPLYRVIPLSALDHPNVRGERDFYKGAVNVGWPPEMEEQWGIGHAQYQVRVQGQFPDQEEDAVIPLKFIQAAVNRKVATHPDDFAVLGVDVARKGESETVCMQKKGPVCTIEFTENVSNVIELGQRLNNHHTKTIGVDDIGVGAGVTDYLKGCDGVDVVPYTANASSDRAVKRRKRDERRNRARGGKPRSARTKPSEHEIRATSGRFNDLQSEAWWLLRQLLEEGYNNPDDPTKGIRIPDDLDLIYQLNARKYTTENDRVTVLPKNKTEYKTDRADALVIAIRTWYLKTNEQKPLINTKRNDPPSSNIRGR